MTARDHPPDISRRLAAFIDQLSFDDLPPEAVHSVERCLLDTLGVTIAGAAEPPSVHARATSTVTNDGAGFVSVFGEEGVAPVKDAAFVNGTAAHALDFDDETSENAGHPSSPMVAPACAIAERTAGIDGRDLITAYVAGFETQCFLGNMVLPSHYKRGWHTTATIGVFGATAAVSHLLGLSERRIRHALNLTASLSSGLIKNFGSMTKPLHAGHAGQSGLTAATLAERGFTADGGALGDDGGFVDLYAGNEPPGDPPALPPDNWVIVTDGIHFKKYPCCYRTHPAIAVAAELTAEHGIRPADVESVSVTTSQRAHDILPHEDPETGLEAKFSMEYSVASAIAQDRVDLETFTDDAVADPTTEAVRKRVQFEVDPDRPYYDYETDLVIETTGGSVTRTIDHPPGQDVPLSDAELVEKFLMCTVGTMAEPESKDVADRLLRLREANPTELDRLLAAL